MRAWLFSRSFRRRGCPSSSMAPACLLAGRVQKHARPARLDVCSRDPDFSFPSVEPQEPGGALAVTSRAGRVALGPWALCGAGRALVTTQAPLQASRGLRGVLPSQPSGVGSPCT